MTVDKEHVTIDKEHVTVDKEQVSKKMTVLSLATALHRIEDLNCISH